MGKESNKSKKQPELYSDSALNPGYETGSTENPSQLFYLDGSMGNSIVDFDEEDLDTGVDAITEQEIMQHNKNE
ncbi:hypothetical protein [Pseudalkalibacillus sp. SCS-8]|uniref:hypothetical protein n=1 Tax=Pseudalkalibacillus nanhaiensis TaxID=3115291 RepID=UPI0032DB0BDD